MMLGNKMRITLPRPRATGRIVEWKGNFGWIQADAPIDHPAAGKFGGRLYLGHEDVEAEIQGVGAAVSFLLYFDGSSLGAQNCRPHWGPTVQKTIQKTTSSQAQQGWKGNGSPAMHMWGSSARACGDASGWDASGWVKGSGFGDAGGWGKGCGGCGDAGDMGSWAGKAAGSGIAGCWGKGCGVEDSSGWVRPPVAANLSGSQDRAADPSGPAKAPAPNKTGHKLPRKRVTEVKTTGDVVSFLPSGYGWIQPHVPIDHPRGKERNGRIFVGKTDIKGISGEPQPNQLVQFHVYCDESGLGAEECEPF